MKNQSEHFRNKGNVGKAPKENTNVNTTGSTSTNWNYWGGNDFWQTGPPWNQQNTFNYQTYTNIRVYEVPDVYITVNQHRKKMVGDKIYLKDGTNFELEIFNKDTVDVYVGLKLNGIEDEQKLIINPGQRVFVDRHISQQKKLQFNTYNVEANNKAVDKAISNNGLVELTFHVEDKPLQPITFNDSGYTATTTSNNNTFFCNTDNITMDDCTTINIGSVYSSNTISDYDISREKNVKDSKLKETGKIEKGDESDQHFVTKWVDIQLMMIGSQTFRLMPESMHKPQTNYCTSCGVKQRKTSWKFCPSCGNAY